MTDFYFKRVKNVPSSMLQKQQNFVLKIGSNFQNNKAKS